jgi:UDP-GlcNAc:undecaprenyl-phosphate GlcNAc-1-phosphate transferase
MSAPIERVYTLVEVLKPHWWVGVVALVLTLAATPVLRWIAYRAKIVDRPDDLLKTHRRPVAYLGGVGMYLGLLGGLLGYIASRPHLASEAASISAALGNWQWGDLARNPLWNVIGIAASSMAIMIVGLLDDLLDLKPRQKLLGQALAAVLLLAGGVGVRMSYVVFGLLSGDVPDSVIVACSIPFCFLVVMGACNATNLIDGLDGLCGGVTGIIALGFLALSAYLAEYVRAGDIDEIRIVLCFAMAGAVLGFLPYNASPASIFMGDAGSMLLGFFVATMMALFCQEGNSRWFLAACAVFALPILDTALAVVRRLFAGAGIFAGDRSHLYDQLVDRGMTVRQVVILFYGLAAAAAAIGVSVAVLVRQRYAIIIYLGLLAIVWLVFHKLGMVVPRETLDAASRRNGPTDTERGDHG